MTSIRSLDPVDPDAPVPDGAQLLQSVLATPPPTRRRGVGLLQLVPVGLAVALVAGVAVVALSVTRDGGTDEQEVTTGAGSAAIVHYVVRERDGAPDGPLRPVATTETWQLEDGSRARTITNWKADGPLHGTTSEDVVTSTLSLAYRPAAGGQPERIIRYRASDDFAAIPEDPPSFAAPPIGGSAAVGDPRTVPDRLAAGDKDVTQLADATVRDIPVKQFQVGDCRESTTQNPDGIVPLPQRAIVALARDTLTPVRVTHEYCESDRGGPAEAHVLDYLSFEELPATPANLKQLELSPHPDVPVVDGIEIDEAEKRDEAGPAPTPTPTIPPTGG